MLAEALYFVSLSLFGFVILGATRLPNDMWLVIAIFPVFIAAILGFVMWLFAYGQLDLWVSIGSLAVSVAVVLALRRLSTRDMFIAIWVTLVLGLVCARFALLAADIG